MEFLLWWDLLIFESLRCFWTVWKLVDTIRSFSLSSVSSLVTRDLYSDICSVR